MNDFQAYKRDLFNELLKQSPIHTGSWQRIDTRESAAHATHELLDVTVRVDVSTNLEVLQEQLQPDLPWAEEHFLERINGIPVNPPPSHEIWPYGQFNGRHMPDGYFSHTYPERFWPRHAGEVTCHGPYVGENEHMIPVDKYGMSDDGHQVCKGRMGIRYRYGDLEDVINLLSIEPLTRQAFLPIWFPEDTGVHSGQRVPCTLGYHFLIRDDVLSCRYYMRSCDLYRHFTNDIYMAARLMQHIAASVNDLNYYDYRDDDRSPMDPPDFVALIPGQLTMYISSLHLFVGDVSKVTRLYNA